MVQAEKVINKYLLGLLIMLLGAFLFYGLSEFFSAFLGAVIFYILFRKFMAYLVFSKNFRKPFAAIIIIIISFFIVVLPVGFLVLMIVNKVSSIIKNKELINEYTNLITEKVDQLPGNFSADNLGEYITSFTSSHAGGMINSTFSVAASLVMMYFLLYFLLIGVRKIENQLLYYLPIQNERLNWFGKELVNHTFGNAIGVPAVAAAQGLAAWGCYSVAGVQDAGLYGILTGFSSIIPLVGTAIIWVPVAIFLLATNMIWQGIFVTGFCIIIMTNLDNIVRMVVSKRIGDIHPVITVLGVIFGLKFFGLPGLVFGPLLISYLLLLLKIFHLEYNKKQEPISDAEEDTIDGNALMKLINRYLFFTESMKNESDKEKRRKEQEEEQKNKSESDYNDDVHEAGDQ